VVVVTVFACPGRIRLCIAMIIVWYIYTIITLNVTSHDTILFGSADWTECCESLENNRAPLEKSRIDE
jgi:hypothetical protein